MIKSLLYIQPAICVHLLSYVVQVFRIRACGKRLEVLCLRWSSFQVRLRPDLSVQV